MDMPFSSVVASLADLRTVVGEPGEVARRKQIDHLDAWCRDYLARAPYVLMATADAQGRCDVSPKGDRPGFIHVIDDRHLAIPERPGNRRLDSVTNLFENPHVGLLFVVPGFDETLRVNGRACLTRDADLLAQMTMDGKAPIFAFGVAVDEVFVHCAKAARRAGLWQPDRWPELQGLPHAAVALHAHARPAGKTVQDVSQALAESYAKTLY
jgi:hypothetical protein